jgi:hypothetical protein
MNLFQGLIEADDGRVAAKLTEQLPVGPKSQEKERPALAAFRRRSTTEGSRPDHISVGHQLTGNLSVLRATFDLMVSPAAEIIVPFRIQADHLVGEGSTLTGENSTLPLRLDSATGPGVARGDPRRPIKVGKTENPVMDTDLPEFLPGLK